MTKQEFLAMSLPYRLRVYVKCHHNPDNSELETMIGIVDDCIITDTHEEDIAPLADSYYGLCLHPLSDLTKEIEHKGEKFVPMDRIAIYNPNNLCYFIECILTGMVEWIVVTKLIEWHFDIADLISKGEAIDVNTLEVNPYK